MIDIEAARKVCEAATPGPWNVSGEVLWVCGAGTEAAHQWVQIGDGEEDGCVQTYPVPVQTQEQIGQMSENDCVFSSQARTLLPAALDELEAVRKEVERLRERLTTTRGYLIGIIEQANTADGHIEEALSPEAAL